MSLVVRKGGDEIGALDALEGDGRGLRLQQRHGRGELGGMPIAEDRQTPGLSVVAEHPKLEPAGRAGHDRSGNKPRSPRSTKTRRIRRSDMAFTGWPEMA